MKITVSPRIYLLVGVGLLLLLALTAGLSQLSLGRLNAPVAIGIAVAKALLIVLFFMHVRFSKQLIWLFASLGFVWLGVLFTLSMSDFLTRGVMEIAGK